jgi:DNA (cytosine-5)-methyltransferase 1
VNLTVFSTFSGIGGFELGFAHAHIPTVGTVEIDPAARGLLTHRFPHATHHTDIRGVTADDVYATGNVPDGTILTGGFPCQDLSVAGRRAGLAGERSGLFHEWLRLLRDARPGWFILENVPGLLSSHGGRDMGTIVGALADSGYEFCWRVLDAQHFGLPQRRKRVFIVGRAGTGTGVHQVLLEPEGGGGNPAAGDETGTVAAALTASGVGAGGADGNVTAGTLGSTQGGWASDVERMTFIPAFVKTGRPTQRDGSETWVEGGPHPTLNQFDVGDTRTVALTLMAKTQRFDPSEENLIPVTMTGNVTHTLTSGGADASEDGTGRGTPLTPTAEGVRRLTPVECERLQGFPDHWTARRFDERRGSVVDQADSARYKQLGNAVAVPVITWIANRIKAAP